MVFRKIIPYVSASTLAHSGTPYPVVASGRPGRITQSLVNRLRTGEAGEYSFRVRNAQGGYRWFLSRVEPLRASDGTLLQWVGVNLDIEELKRAEQALRESEYKLRQIIETVPSLLWSMGPHGEQTQINQRALDYIGVRYEDLLRLGWTAFLHPDDLSETANAFSHAMQTGTPFRLCTVYVGRTASIRWHHARGEPLRDRQGRVIQWYGLTVDIDEGKRPKTGCAAVRPISPKPSA